MEDLNKKYKKVLKEWTKIKTDIEELKKKPDVVKYIDLCFKQKDIGYKVDNLYEQILEKKYKSCNHVLVLSNVDHDYCEGRCYRYYGCVKCGFDSYVYERGYGTNYEEKAMLNIMRKNKWYHVSGTYTGVACELADGRKLWNDIQEKNKYLDEEEVIQIFKKRCNSNEKNISKREKN